MKVFVINWCFDKRVAQAAGSCSKKARFGFGLVGVYDPELGKQILALLEEHSGTKQFIGVEVEVVGA